MFIILIHSTNYIQPEVSVVTTPATLLVPDPITVGEALETAAFTAADKPVDQSDAAAIQAAEMRATRSNEVLPGGIASEAQFAATRNSRMEHGLVSNRILSWI